MLYKTPLSSPDFSRSCGFKDPQGDAKAPPPSLPKKGIIKCFVINYNNKSSSPLIGEE